VQAHHFLSIPSPPRGIPKQAFTNSTLPFSSYNPLPRSTIITFNVDIRKPIVVDTFIHLRVFSSDIRFRFIHCLFAPAFSGERRGTRHLKRQINRDLNHRNTTFTHL
jgi:hypothetical protein